MNALLIVDKPPGKSSFWVVARIRKILGEKKAGHAGALDPLATGVLVIGLGGATRIMKYVEAAEKVYVGTIQLGSSTDTDDAEGKTLFSKPVPLLSDDELQTLFASFTGRIAQRPPAFSAIKIKGERAYKMARRGETFEVKSRDVEVRELSLLGYDSATGQISFRARCSKGTYVRSLARDMGERLACGGHLKTLRRESVGSFGLSRAVSLEGDVTAETLRQGLLPLEEALNGLPQVVVTQSEESQLRMGRPALLRTGPPFPGEGVVLTEQGRALCLTRCDIRPGRVFLLPSRMLQDNDNTNA